MVDIVTKPDLDTQIAGRAPLVHTHVKGDVGLGNVDNTSDANKPVSTAQAAAIAEVNSKAITTTSIITSATRPANPIVGVRYKESDTEDVIAWNGSRWQKVGGLPRPIASNPNSGGTGNLGVTAGAGAIQAARSIAVPAHVPGTLRFQYTGIWSATGGQALWGQLRYGGSFATAPEIAASRMRAHNAGAANTPAPLICEGYWNSDGTATTLWLGTYVEAVVTTTMVDGAFRVWIEPQDF